MTLAAPEFPLTAVAALQHLTDALGANYTGATDEATLTRALGVDAFAAADGTVHIRPWATAARLISDNTEYEVTKGMEAKFDRKIRGLETQQTQADAIAGILHLLPSSGDTSWPPVSGSVPTEGRY